MLVPLVLVMGLPPTDLAGVARNEALLALGGLTYIAMSAALARWARLLAGGGGTDQSRHRLCVALGLRPYGALGGAPRL